MQTNISNDKLRFSMAWFLQRFVLAPGLRLYTRLINSTEVLGVENLEALEGENFLVCPNHTSAWDIWAGFEVGFHAMKTYFANDTYMCGLGAIERLGPWPVRTFCLSAGVLPVDRSQGLDQYAIRDVLRLFEQKEKRVACLVYPEGTRSRTGRLASKFKAGIGWIQAHTSAPVVPVYQMGWDQLPAVGQKLKIVIGKPMRFDDLADEAENPTTWIEIATRIMDAIRELELATNPEAAPPRLDPVASGLLFDSEKWSSTLRDLKRPLTFVEQDERVGLLCGPHGLAAAESVPGASIRLKLPAASGRDLGNPEFRKRFAVDWAMTAAPMERGLTRVEFSAALARSGFLAVHAIDFHDEAQIREELDALRAGAQGRSFAVGMRYHPHHEGEDERRFDLLREMDVDTAYVAGYVRATRAMLAYRYASLKEKVEGEGLRPRKLVVRVSHVELARHFAQPAPSDLLDELRTRELLSEEERALAEGLPMADAIVVEGDLLRSGTRRDLGTLLPAVATVLRDGDASSVLLGAAGDLASPEALEGAFAMGADFVVVGDPFQLTLEAGGAPDRKALLARLQTADVTTVPSYEYLEADWRVHVARFGSPFAARATRLERILRDHDEGRPLDEKDRSFLERQLFGGPLDDCFERARPFFEERWPELLRRADDDGKLRLPLLARKYLWDSQSWGNEGNPEHKLDWQLRCGPGMGAFNLWRADSPLAELEKLDAATLARSLMNGAAVVARLASVGAAGLGVPQNLRPLPPLPLD